MNSLTIARRLINRHCGLPSPTRRKRFVQKESDLLRLLPSELLRHSAFKFFLRLL